MTIKSFNTEKKEINRYLTHLEDLKVYESRKNKYFIAENTI